MEKEAKSVEFAALAKMLQGVLSNQQALADSMQVKLPFTVADIQSVIINNEHAENVLPQALKSTMRNKNAFDEAVKKGFIELTSDGHLRWMLHNSTLLAYFCGRMWCGDTGMYSRRKGTTVWHKGTGLFPAKELNRMFGMTTLKTLRLNRSNRALPDYFELIDELFSM